MTDCDIMMMNEQVNSIILSFCGIIIEMTNISTKLKFSNFVSVFIIKLKI